MQSREEERRQELPQLDAWLLSLTPAQRWALTVFIVEAVLFVAFALACLFPALTLDSLSLAA